MSVSQDRQLFMAELQDRRGDTRIELSLPGRYMLSDRRECICRTLNISPSGFAIMGLDKGSVGQRIVAYFKEIGRVEGVITRHFDECLGVRLLGSARNRER